MFPKTVHSRYGIRVKVSWSGPEGAFGSPAASPVASCGSKTWGESAGGEFRNSHHAWLGQQYIPWLGKVERDNTLRTDGTYKAYKAGGCDWRLAAGM